MEKQFGNTLGQYQVLDEIGRGGMATVYRAYQPSLQRYVAIKILPPQLAVDSAFVQRFLQEARSAARLEHPNIVAIHDVGEVDGTYFIVMQLLQGEPLNRLIQRAGRLPLERMARITSQVASALDYAHKQGFVHRDVKPANIIVGPGDHATLTDFGVAKAAQSGHLTQTGVAIGTPEYMSPEQAKGDPVGPASDIYALGLVAYEMLTGEVPFKADSTPAVLYKQVHERPASVRSKVPGLPATADKALARALAKIPADRFRTAGEFAAALTGSVSTRPSGVVPIDPPTVAASAAIKPAAMSVARASSGLPKWALPAVGIALVIVLTAIMLPGVLGGDKPAPPAPITAVDLPSLVAANTAMVEVAAVEQATPTKVIPASKSTPTRQQVSTNRTGHLQMSSSQDINVYGGPGKQFGKTGQVEANKAYEIVARTEDSSWWLICCVGGEPVWIDANLVTATGDATSAPVATAVALSTDTPNPTPTPVPQPLPTRIPASLPPTPTPQAAPVKPIPPPQPAGDCRPKGSLPPVTLIAPEKDKTCNGSVRFIWQWSDRLRSGEIFELHLWPNEKLNRNSVARSTETSLVTDISKVGWILWERPNHWWEVIVVCKADGRWVSQEPGPRLIYFDGRIPGDPNNPDANCR